MKQIPVDTVPAHTGELPLSQEDQQKKRENALVASFASQLGCSDLESRQRLFLIGLFQDYVCSRILSSMCQEQFNLPVSLAGLTEGGWAQILDAASDLKMLSRKRKGNYATTQYVDFQKLAQEALAAYQEEIEKAFVNVYHHHGIQLTQTFDTNFHLTMLLLQLDEKNLLYALHLGCKHELWDNLPGVLDGLNLLWTTQGSWDEWERLVLDLEALTLGAKDEALEERRNLWHAIIGYKQELADFRLNANCSDPIHRRLKQLGDAKSLAIAFYKLGSLTLKHSNSDAPERWFRQSLRMSEYIGNETYQAEILHKMGMVVQSRQTIIIFFGPEKVKGEIAGYARTMGQTEAITENDSTLNNANWWQSVADNDNVWADAVRCYEQSISLKERLKDEKGQAKVLCSLAGLAEFRKHWNEAEQFYRQALRISESIGTKSRMAECLHGLGQLAEKRGQWDEAELWYRQFVSLGANIGDAEKKVQVLNSLAKIVMERGEWENAEQLYKQALDISERLKNEKWQARFLHQLGRVAAKRGDEHWQAIKMRDLEALKRVCDKKKFWDAAMWWYEQSLSIKARIGDKYGYAITLHDLAAVSVKNGQWVKAQQWYRQNLSYFELSGKEEWQATTLCELGKIATEARQWEEAEQWYGQAVKIWERLGNFARHAVILYRLGRIATQRSQTEEAEKYFSQSYAIGERIHDEGGQAVNLYQLGIIADSRDSWDEAALFYSRSEAIFIRLKDDRYLRDVRSSMKNMQYRKKNNLA